MRHFNSVEANMRLRYFPALNFCVFLSPSFENFFEVGSVCFSLFQLHFAMG